MSRSRQQPSRCRGTIILALLLGLGGQPFLGVDAWAACSQITCPGNPCTITGTHDVDAGCALAFAGKDVTVGQGAVLRNATGGGFSLRARSLVLRGTLRAPGAWVLLVADDAVTMAANGEIDVGSTAVAGGWVDVIAGGNVTLGRVLGTGRGLGGSIDARTDGAITVTGPLRVHATDPGGGIWPSAGGISLDAVGNITVNGDMTADATGTNPGAGGDVEVWTQGHLTLGSSALVRANGTNGGAGGSVRFDAEGTATMAGNVEANCGGVNATGGDLTLWAWQSVALSGTWSANGQADGGGTVDIGSDAGVTVAGSASLRATAGGGGSGGQVDIAGSGDVSLAGSVDATASGPNSRGGSIYAGAGTGRMLTVSATLDVTSSAGSGQDGWTGLDGCTVVLSGTLRANQHPNGRNYVWYNGGFTVTSTGRMRAGTTGGNVVGCACAGVNLRTRTCATPLACASAPVRLGSGVVAPAWRISPVVAPPCSCFDGARNGSETAIDCGGPACFPCIAGSGCTTGADCFQGVCTAGLCQDASCADGVRNGNESGLDCGGSCQRCPVGQPCGRPADCLSDTCVAGVCRAAGCADGVQNNLETDVDCGGGACAACPPPRRCRVATDCDSGVCTNLVCQAPTCPDGVQNGSETDVDCGGGCVTRCAAGEHCGAPSDCESGVCMAGVCRAPACPDGVRNATETDVDCGGPGCPACGDGLQCAGDDANCTSHVCTDDVCQEPTCADGVRNGGEADVDCGNGCPTKCGTNKHCGTPIDCESGVCMGGTCQGARCDDGVTNGSETDLDCGGAHRCGSGWGNWAGRWFCYQYSCDGCDPGRHCVSGADCNTGVCTQGTCAMATCMDAVWNGSETDLNCGGGACPRCADGEFCEVGARDCASGVCIADRCAAPRCDDGVKNGSESDVDCGGGCLPCGFDRPCATPGDCQSGACLENGVCGCPDDVVFEHTVESSKGGAGSGAGWPGGTVTLSSGGGCDVTIGLPDKRIDLVCTLGEPFTVQSTTGFSSCTVESCGGVSCPPGGIGSCCADRPSCSTALYGSARATVSVRCRR